jgi:hypothetical protein
MGETPPLPTNVLAYETSSGASGARGRRGMIAAWIFAGLSLLIAVAQAAGGAWVAIGMSMEADPEALFWVPVMAVAAAAGALAGVAAVQVIARRATRFAPLALAAAAGVTLLVDLALMGQCVASRHTTGWDQLIVVFAMFFAAIATVALWLYAATAVLAMRARRLAGDTVSAPAGLRRSLVAVAIAPLPAAAGAYLLFTYLP